MATEVNTHQAPLKTAKIEYVFSRKILNRVVDDMYWDKYGGKESIPANSNVRKAFARRYKNLLPAMTPLAEYDGTFKRTGNKIVMEEIEYEVDYYGDFVLYNDRTVIENLRSQVTSDFADILAQQASYTVDSVHRDVIFSGSNIIFADGGTSSANVAAGLKRITPGDIKMAGIKLKKQGAMKYKRRMGASKNVGTVGLRAAYLMTAHDTVIEDLRELNGFKAAETYANRGDLEENEMGMIGQFRVMEVDNVKIVDENGVNVYSSLLMGKKAYSVVTMGGHSSIKTIVKRIGSAGTEDPLNEVGSIGWKVIAGAVITNNAHLIEMKSTVSMEDTTAKHYYA